MKKTRQLSLILIIIVSMVLPSNALAATFTVTNNNDSGAGSLRQTIADATGSPGDDIIDFNGDYTITLLSTLTIGTNITIDGSGHTIIISGNDLVQVMNITSGTVSLNALTITNGSANDGGGIVNDGTLTITDSTFSHNAAIYGGGIVNDGTLTITDSTFLHNTAIYGGGIVNDDTLTVTDSTFDSNFALSEGGGIFNEEATLTVTNSTFDSNSADEGGGIFNEEATLTVTNSTFDSNFADEGGGIANSGTLTITDSTFLQNEANGEGGGIRNGGTLTVTNGTFSSNEAWEGGAILNDNIITSISNSTFSNNNAMGYGGGGGAISNYNIITSIANSTFSKNKASYGFGGAINNTYADIDTITDCTFSGNEAGDGGAIENYMSSSITTISNSIFSDNKANGGLGGAIDNYESGIDTISNNTFSGNSAAYGGGIYNYFAYSEITTITNSTFFSNSAEVGGGGIYNAESENGPEVNSLEVGKLERGRLELQGNNNPEMSIDEINFGGIITTIANTIITNSPSGGNCAGYSPDTNTNNLTDSSGCWSWTDTTLVPATHLGLLADNGGLTKTHALLVTTPANPAIDTSGVGATTEDQRGIAAIGIRDIGAYEAGASILTVTSTIPNAGASVESPTSIIINFNEDALQNGSNKAANYIDNYLLVERGINDSFDTLSCEGGEIFDDIKQAISSATYTNNGGSGPFSATLTLASPLADGNYRLFICGTTSIWSVAGLELNNGLFDSTLDFTIQAEVAPAPASLPKTGFPHGRITSLPNQPTTKAYTETAMMLEIPKLGVSMPIVGVPQSDAEWDVNWLGNSAGYLAGSAFPTWAGNTVITGHVWDSFNQPGLFAELKSLKYGDQVQIKAWGQVYTYEVRESNLVTTKNVSAVLQSEEYDWVTLVTCEFYNPFSGDYLFRRSVRAILVSVR